MSKELDSYTRALADVMGISPSVAAAFRDVLLGALRELPVSVHRRLRELERTGDVPAPAKGRADHDELIYVAEIARCLHVTPRRVRQKIREWSTKYGMRVIRVGKCEHNSALAIRRQDWASLLRCAPNLLKAPQGRRRRARTALVVARPDEALACPRCGSTRVRCNGKRAAKRYFKCEPCARKGARPTHFIVRVHTE